MMMKKVGSRSTSAVACIGALAVVAFAAAVSGTGSTDSAGGSVSSSAVLSSVAHARLQDEEFRARLLKISGPDACGECHPAELEAWRQSTHFATWSTMHRKPEAREIAEKMGYTTGIKRNDLCLTCHYTSRWEDDGPDPFAGVSCESCHGPARDWIDVHSDVPENETAEQRQARIAASDEAGMIRSAEIYHIARNCYTCHTVPNEELVNKGGHPAGSAFELVAWSQGEVRHNYHYSTDESNREATPERKRVLYVTGRLTDLEFSLRALAKAEGRGTYLVAMLRRVNDALDALDAIQKSQDIAEITTALAAVPRREAGDRPEYEGDLRVTLSSLAELVSVADAVSEATQAFVNNHDGTELAAIDGLLPAPSEYRGVAQN